MKLICLTEMKLCTFQYRNEALTFVLLFISTLFFKSKGEIRPFVRQQQKVVLLFWGDETEGKRTWLWSHIEG